MNQNQIILKIRILQKNIYSKKIQINHLLQKKINLEEIYIKNYS